MIKAIIFDCFGVLYRGSLTHMLQYVAAERHDEVRDANKSFDYGYMSRSEYMAMLHDATGLSVEQIEAIRKERHVRNDELIGILQDLKQTYKIGLLSNIGYDSLRGELFSDDELATYFDAMVLSSDVHIIKPNPDIFVMMADRLGVLPEECVMVDDLLQNIRGANDAGMPGIVFTSNQQFTATLQPMLEVGARA